MIALFLKRCCDEYITTLIYRKASHQSLVHGRYLSGCWFLFSQDLGTQETPAASLVCSHVSFSTSAACVLTGWQSTSIPIGSSDVSSPWGFLLAESDLYRQQKKVPIYHRPTFWRFGLNNFKPNQQCSGKNSTSNTYIPFTQILDRSIDPSIHPSILDPL